MRISITVINTTSCLSQTLLGQARDSLGQDAGKVAAKYNSYNNYKATLTFRLVRRATPNDVNRTGRDKLPMSVLPDRQRID